MENEKTGGAGKYLNPDYKNTFDKNYYDKILLRIRRDGKSQGLSHGITAEFIRECAQESNMSTPEFILSRACQGMAANGELPEDSKPGDSQITLRGDEARDIFSLAKKLNVTPEELIALSLLEYRRRRKAKLDSRDCGSTEKN